MDPPSINLVASTSNPDGHLRPRRNEARTRHSFFKTVQWSADGTTLFTSSYSNRICAFVLPETLLEPRQSPVNLTAHGTLTLPEPTSAIAPCPYFALEQPSTQVLLTASTDHPIHLHHAFPPSPSSASSPLSPTSPPASPPSSSDDNPDPPPPQPPPLASFHLVKRETEAYLPVASLLWPAPGTHFVAGTTNRIALFDVSRPDALQPAPLLSIPTIPSTRHLAKGGGVGMRGTVSALAAQPLVDGGGWGGLLAAGTWTRSLGLYDLARSGECVATWGVAGAAAEAGVGGKGVVQALWSPCGRYLVVNERGATGLLVYDLRGTHRLLGWLEGRDGRTNQRLSCDVFPGAEGTGGFEVWAGTKNGGVVVWEGVGNQEGGVRPSWDWKAHGSAVGATAMHMSGSVVATCSGSWEIVDPEVDTSESSDSSGSSDSSDSSDESGSESSAAVQRTSKPRVVVRETSLKVWSLGSGLPARTERESPDDR
ncbi:ce092909-c0a3-4961-9d6c-bf6b27316f97 [Thermothielavioides terrestris]|uniref:Ce092909-c0a3-4961-9d6c-bf6b27316f97 n=1 Tax=Thermothielavioides terrestris TaxID=2587410 RepID=A0A3S5CXM0_9PEZI|nr:ce092909-c0a3-4961-9d6c-bf6b27316f97 [Thermothielavioides terrestris]